MMLRDKDRRHDLKRSLAIRNGIDFCSNDYLGMAKNGHINHRVINFLEKEQSLWNSSSRLISGTTEVHRSVENYLAQFIRREETLSFTSGYNACAGVVETLCEGSLVFSDELNHASLISGMKSCRAEKHIYRHNDLDHLENLLKEHSKNPLKKIIVTESVFSMDGTLSDLCRLNNLCLEYDCFCIIDEAHATGVFGHKGEGRVLGCMNEEHTLSIHTCGKAFGCNGAFVACSAEVKDYLINFCKHFIYTTALSPLMMFMMKESVAYQVRHQELRQSLWNNINFIKAHFNPNLESQIFPIGVTGNRNVLRAERRVSENGYSVCAIRYPTVAAGSERLRLSIHADHTFDDIKALLNLIEQKIRE